MVRSTSIRELILKNPLHAFQFHNLGIDYVAFQNHTLPQACEILNKPFSKILEQIEDTNLTQESLFELNQKNIFHIIDHLLANHHHYLKSRLPFIESTFKYLSLNYNGLEKLRDEFSKFKIDFLEHLEFEENVFFPYSELLEAVYQNGSQNFSYDYFVIVQQYSNQQFEEQHSNIEEEFEVLKNNISEVLNQYRFDIQANVILGELDFIYEDLLIHAEIEENILAPKVLKLERFMKKEVDRISILN